jgi:LAGLIDADG endonuclease
MTGFTDVEGCFSVSIYKPTYNNRILLRIAITQHSRDKLLMDALRSTLNCGIVSKHSNNAVILTIYRFKDIYNKIIPLFNEYKIRGVKTLDFQEFCKIAEIIHNMNKGRYKKKKRKSCYR